MRSDLGDRNADGTDRAGRASWLLLAPAMVSAIAAVGGCGAFGPSHDNLTTEPPASGTTLQWSSSDQMMIEVEVNGQAGKALIDTGLPFTLATPDAISKFGLQVGEHTGLGGAAAGGVCGNDEAATRFRDRFYTAQTLALGDAVFEDASLVIADTGESTPFGALDVDLVVGASIMAEMDWLIEPAAQRITFYPLGSRARPADAVGLAVDVADQPFTPIRVAVMSVNSVSCGGADGSFIFDTGASPAISLGPEAAGGCGIDVNTPEVRDRLLGGFDGVCVGSLGRSAQVTVGGETFTDVATLVLPDETVEPAIRLVGFGYVLAHQSVYVSPQWYLRTDEIRTQYGRSDGAWIEFVAAVDTQAQLAAPVLSFGFDAFVNADGMLEVGVVHAGLDASVNGVQIGDLIVAVDGLDATSEEGEALFESFDEVGQTATFAIRAPDGSTWDVTLTLAELL